MKSLASLCILSTLAVMLVALAPSREPAQRVAATAVTRATLKNGLQVVILRDPFAPVVSMYDELPGGCQRRADHRPRPCARAHDVPRKQDDRRVAISEVTAITGGNFNADTQNEITQYFFDVPAQVSRHRAAISKRSRAQGSSIRKRVGTRSAARSRRKSCATIQRGVPALREEIQHNLLAGTPYADEGLGTVRSFQARSKRPTSSVLCALVSPQQRDHGDRRRRRSAGDDREGARRCSARFRPKALPARKPVHLAAVHAADVARQQLRSR